MTRTAEKGEQLRAAGATPVVCDVFDRDGLHVAVADAKPDVVLHQLTDLPDQAHDLARYAARNRRIRTEGTRNLLDAARSAHATRLIGQSIAWTAAPGSRIAEHEQMILDADGLVIRYGAFYGPGTWASTDDPPPHPRIHVDDAARRTVAALEAAPGIIVLTDS